MGHCMVLKHGGSYGIVDLKTDGDISWIKRIKNEVLQLVCENSR